MVKRLLWLGAFCLLFSAYGPIRHVVGRDAPYGPHGPEGPRLREQLWIVPGADPHIPLRATLFRPAEQGAAKSRRPLVIINHGSDAATREAVALPVFYWLSKWFVDRGYVVLLPQRRGYGATGGELAEGNDTCAEPDHFRAGMAAAEDIEAALHYMAAQRFIDPYRIIVAGVSTGGWAALAVAARNPPGLEMVINFAGGRGGHAYGQHNVICGPERLVEATSAFAKTAKVPTVWIYSSNDSYFGPDIANAMVKSWQDNGGNADFRMLPAYGSEGHEIATDRAGAAVWGPYLDRSLRLHTAGGRAERVRLSGVH